TSCQSDKVSVDPLDTLPTEVIALPSWVTPVGADPPVEATITTRQRLAPVRTPPVNVKVVLLVTLPPDAPSIVTAVPLSAGCRATAAIPKAVEPLVVYPAMALPVPPEVLMKGAGRSSPLRPNSPEE
ncbi:hypothetical protein LCGC14_2656520, partial [marine sediment metagenome]